MSINLKRLPEVDFSWINFRFKIYGLEKNKQSNEEVFLLTLIYKLSHVFVSLKMNCIHSRLIFILLTRLSETLGGGSAEQIPPFKRKTKVARLIVIPPSHALTFSFLAQPLAQCLHARVLPVTWGFSCQIRWRFLYLRRSKCSQSLTSQACLLKVALNRAVAWFYFQREDVGTLPFYNHSSSCGFFIVAKLPLVSITVVFHGPHFCCVQLEVLILGNNNFLVNAVVRFHPIQLTFIMKHISQNWNAV